MDRLAKQQACQLFIEQEIEKGLKEGKTKYAIGQEIATWIKKLFQADVKPHTITMKAHRIEDGLITNVTTEPTPEYDSGKEEIQVEHTHGGAREGAGRPVKLAPPSNGMQFARMAVADLEQIRKDDLQRDEAFAFVKGWIRENE